MEKTDNSGLHQLISYRIIFLLCGIVSPIISITWADQNSNAISDVGIGWILSIVFACCFILSFFSKRFKSMIVYVIYVLFLIVTVSALYHSYINHFNIEYTILYVITLFGVSIIINRPLLLFFYYLINFILIYEALYFSSDTFIKKSTLAIMLFMFFIISNINAWSKYFEHKQLIMSEERYRLIVGQMREGLAVHEIVLDDKGKPSDYRFLSVNNSFERLTGLRRENIVGRTVMQVLPNTEKYWIDIYGKVALTGVPYNYENYSSELNKHFSVFAFSSKKNQFAVIMTDITETKNRQEKIEFLSFHDQLTGIYNRKFYEKEMIRLDDEKFLPLSLIMIDVNGLKLANDAFGHIKGDLLLKKVAKILDDNCRLDDSAARIGGDEFVVLLPKTYSDHADLVIEEINKAIAEEKIENVILSISAGRAVRISASEDLNDIFKKAEDDMYRHKLSDSSSMRSKTIDLIMNTLYEKNEREMLHSKRVGQLCMEIATKMNFDKDAINQMKVAGYMHDIGKIGIYEKILNKPKTLNIAEWDEIERHSEIGYRILSSVNEFSEIADYILEHHEKWNGEGYPMGLKGEDISIQARIISVADAFDAMTTDRTYRKALSEEEAVNEIRKFSNIQFDPAIAKVFIEKVLGRNWETIEIPMNGIGEIFKIGVLN